MGGREAAEPELAGEGLSQKVLWDGTGQLSAGLREVKRCWPSFTGDSHILSSLLWRLGGKSMNLAPSQLPARALCS